MCIVDSCLENTTSNLVELTLQIDLRGNKHIFPPQLLFIFYFHKICPHCVSNLDLEHWDSTASITHGCVIEAVGSNTVNWKLQFVGYRSAAREVSLKCIFETSKLKSGFTAPGCISFFI